MLNVLDPIEVGLFDLICKNLEIIIPDSVRQNETKSRLILFIQQQFDHVSIVTTERRHFNDDNGFSLVEEYSADPLIMNMPGLRSKFGFQMIISHSILGTFACHVSVPCSSFLFPTICVIKRHIELVENIVFQPKTILFKYETSEGTATIGRRAHIILS